MNNLKYIDKVIMSCKDLDQLEVARSWAMSYCSKNIGLLEGQISMIDIEYLSKNMIEYIKKRDKLCMH